VHGIGITEYLPFIPKYAARNIFYSKRLISRTLVLIFDCEDHTRLSLYTRQTCSTTNIHMQANKTYA